MTVSAKATGSQTTSGTTEHSLAVIVDPGVYELHLDLRELTGGATPDILEVREKRSVLLESPTDRAEEWCESFVGGACPDNVTFRAKMTVVDIEYTIKMAQGADRKIKWSINQVA